MNQVLFKCGIVLSDEVCGATKKLLLEKILDNDIVPVLLKPIQKNFI